jgi:hypothetical protein
MWWVGRLVVCVWRVVCGVCVVSAVGVRDTLAVSWNSAGSGAQVRLLIDMCVAHAFTRLHQPTPSFS